jgi:hypothetical protein
MASNSLGDYNVSEESIASIFRAEVQCKLSGSHGGE